MISGSDTNGVLLEYLISCTYLRLWGYHYLLTFPQY